MKSHPKSSFSAGCIKHREEITSHEPTRTPGSHTECQPDTLSWSNYLNNVHLKKTRIKHKDIKSLNVKCVCEVAQHHTRSHSADAYGAPAKVEAPF